MADLQARLLKFIEMSTITNAKRRKKYVYVVILNITCDV